MRPTESRRVLVKVKDWTDAPGGAMRANGPFSAQEFLEDHLLPIFTANPRARIILDFDGLFGTPMTFMRHLFSTLTLLQLREGEWQDRLGIICNEDKSVIEDATNYIESARKDLPKPPKDNQLKPKRGL